MERLTNRQLDVFRRIIRGDKPPQIARDLGVTPEAIHYRIDGLVKKGYLVKEKEDGAYFKDVKLIPTSEGLELIRREGYKTKHSYWDNVRVEKSW